MSKPITRRSVRPITRRIPILPKSPTPANPDEIRRAQTIERVLSGSKLEALEKRVAALEEKLEALGHAPRGAESVDEVTERALEARLDDIASSIEDAAAKRAIDAMTPRIEDLVSDRVKKNKPALDPRTIIELVDTRMGERTGSAAQEVVASQELKSALDARFRSMLAHLENDVIPRVLKKYASGL
ncbi:MAG TPA: hypothetical protein VFF73_21660 [Planctomycetota bacterium]|nr:hypothetical protein [Planctomycetota bacterium]